MAIAQVTQLAFTVVVAQEPAMVSPLPAFPVLLEASI